MFLLVARNHTRILLSYSSHFDSFLMTQLAFLLSYRQLTISINSIESHSSRPIGQIQFTRCRVACFQLN